MKNCNKINKEAAKISTISSGRIDKYNYVTGEKILPFGPSQVIEQDKFTIFRQIKNLRNK